MSRLEKSAKIKLTLTILFVVGILFLLVPYVNAKISKIPCDTNADCSLNDKRMFCWGASSDKMYCHEFCGPDGVVSQEYEDVSGCCRYIDENGVCFGSGKSVEDLKMDCIECLSGTFSWLHKWCPAEQSCKIRLPFFKCSTNEYMTNINECDVYERNKNNSKQIITDKSCEKYKSCEECTLHPGCGWCIGIGCVEGNRTTDKNKICAPIKWIYYSYECEV